MKKFLMIIASLSSILSCSKNIEAKDGKNLLVMSFNIRSDIDGKLSDGENSWCYRQSASYDMFNEIKPDICGIQEARKHQKYDLEMNVPGYVFIGVGRDDGLNKGEHMLVAFKKKTMRLLDWGTFWLSETPDIPSIGWDAAYIRTATWARLKHIPTGKEMFFVNTHIDHIGAEAKKNGLALILKKISEMNTDNLPVVLTGDFNMMPGDEKMADLEASMLDARVSALETVDSPSFNDWGKRTKIIDYIFYSGFDVCAEFKVIDRQFGIVPYISDHYPITAEFIVDN